MATEVGNMAAKLMQNIKASKFLKELKEFDNLIKAIGECKSKAEEDRIIVQELEVLKQRFNDPRLDKSRGREYMVRLIYCEMLGHDASFAYIKALQFASEPNIFTKKAAYLALTQLLDHSNELVLLLVNTLLSDLKSDNYIIVCSALTAATRLIGVDLITAVYPVVVERLRHPKEHVRKKAVMALHRFHQLDPRHEGPLSGLDLDKHFRTTLCDKDPSVMSASLCALYDVMRSDTKPYKNLIPSFTSILKQVSEHRLPKSYDYHRFPAPFIQIKLLKILAVLGAGDKANSENMYAVIHQTLRRANGSHTIGNALIYECVRTITTIYPNPALLAAAAESISSFLKSPSHNLRYVGIDALAGVVKINPAYAQEHQLAVIDCLEDPDDTLKLKTLELLYKMTKSNNVEVIVERMMTYLRTAVDEHIKRDIVRKVGELAERYAPGPSWFMSVMSEVFELGGEHVEPQLAHNLCRLIAEQDEDLHRSAVETYLSLLDKPKQPEILLQVIVWVLGEYGFLAVQQGTSAEELLGRLVGILDRQKPSDTLKAAVLTAMAKVCAHTGAHLTPAADDFVTKASMSQSVELQQRSYELQAILSLPASMKDAALPQDASREDFDEAELAQVRNLSFLDGFVQQALAQGAAPYLSEEARANTTMAAAADGTSKGHLRFDAYETVPSLDNGRSTPVNMATATKAGLATTPGGNGSNAVPAIPQEPQLMLHSAAAAAKSQGKWGPSQFASMEQPAHNTPAAAPPPVGGMHVADLLFGNAPTPAAAQRPSSTLSAATAAPLAVPKPVSERDKLAASIFGGGSGGAMSSSSRSRAATPSRPMPVGPRLAVPQQQQQPPPDLLGGFSPLAQASPAHPAHAGGVRPPRNDVDLLMDLDVGIPPPASTQQYPHQQPIPAASTVRAYDGLDVLSWDAPATAGGIQHQGARNTAEGSLLDGGLLGMPGMSHVMGLSGLASGLGSLGLLDGSGLPSWPRSNAGQVVPPPPNHPQGALGGMQQGGGSMPLLGGGMLQFDSGPRVQQAGAGLPRQPAPPNMPPAFGAFPVPTPQIGLPAGRSYALRPGMVPQAGVGQPSYVHQSSAAAPKLPVTSAKDDPFGDLI